MPIFLYRCPNTGLQIQGWVAADPTERDDETYEAVTCPVCARIHLVNPKTSKLLGEDDDGARSVRRMTGKSRRRPLSPLPRGSAGISTAVWR